MRRCCADPTPIEVENRAGARATCADKGSVRSKAAIDDAVACFSMSVQLPLGSSGSLKSVP